MKAGDCFKVAAGLLLREYADVESATLVHGIVVGQGPIAGVEHWHAWVEFAETVTLTHPGFPDRDVLAEYVVDKANGNDVTLPKALYYKLGRIGDVSRYDHDEARLRMLHHLHYGPWEEAPANR